MLCVDVLFHICLARDEKLQSIIHNSAPQTEVGQRSRTKIDLDYPTKQFLRLVKIYRACTRARHDEQRREIDISRAHK